MRHIGLLGGSFDPIHQGHIALAEQACLFFKLDQVQLIPCYQPAHRQALFANPQQRLQMVQLACQQHDKLIANDIELRLKSTSYTVNTLKALKQHLQSSTLYFIMGADAFNHFEKWHAWQDILHLVNLIVATRQQHQINNKFAQQLLNKYQVNYEEIKKYTAGRIALFDFNALDISSTSIRQQLKKSLDVSRNLKTNVYNFIKQEGLYAT